MIPTNHIAFKSTKASDGMNYPCGGFRQTFFTFPLSW